MIGDAAGEGGDTIEMAPPIPDFDEETGVGKVLDGRYKLERLMSTGGMGAVYEGIDLADGTHVAIKKLRKSRVGDEQIAARFVREARAASAIGHPGIVEVLDTGTDERGATFLVLELLRGKDLAQALRDGGLNLGDVWSITIELLDALAAAHQAGVIHRDIKPENIFLHESDAGRTVKVLDFGIAKKEGPVADTKLTTTGVVMGTPHYMSPEQARGHSIDGRSDLWAVGVLLFRAVSGRMPYEEENYNVLMARMLTEAPPDLADFVPDCPRPLLQAVRGSLCTRRNARFADAATMLQALLDGHSLESVRLGQVRPEWGLRPVQTRDDDPASTEMVSQPPHVRRIRRRQIALAKLAIAGLAAAAIGYSVVRMTRSNPAPVAEASDAPAPAEATKLQLRAEDSQRLPDEAPATPTAERGDDSVEPQPASTSSNTDAVTTTPVPPQSETRRATRRRRTRRTTTSSPETAPPEPAMTAAMSAMSYELLRSYD